MDGPYGGNLLRAGDARRTEELAQPEVAVTLYFDGAAESAILELRSAIYDAGIVPDPGLIEARPHLTLTILESEAIPSSLLRAFAGDAQPREILLTSLGTFGGDSGVIFVAPTPDEGLLELHRALHARLSATALTSRHAYQPGRWVPHCTLEKDVAPAEFARAFESLRTVFRPIEGRLVEVGAVRYPPLETVETAELGDSPPQR